jgi:UDP-2-acetamido-3-amino-2,3-dideoxy-glucuronate N-acetyltransferase
MSVRIGVAGAGYWGKNLLRNFHALGTLYGICESDPERLKTFAGQYPEAKVFQSYEQMLADPQLDAVAVSTPAEQHCWMSIAAVEAGKDVLVEKPLCLERQDGDRVVEAAERQNRVLMVGHLLRYHPAVLKIQELLATGALGSIEYIYSNRLSMGKIRQEENALWSFAPHDVSVILTLVGQMPVQVSATGGAYLQPNIADITISTLLFAKGARAHIFVSWLHPYKEQRLVVIGSKQMIVFEDTHPERKLVLFDKHVEWNNGRLQLGNTEGVPVPFPADEPLRMECAHFIDCVTTRRRPNTPGEEGVAVLQVLEACQRSLQMNGEPVQVQGRVSHRISVL